MVHTGCKKKKIGAGLELGIMIMLGYALLCTPMSMFMTIVVNTHKLNNIKYYKLSVSHPNSKLYSLTQKLITRHNHTNPNTIHFIKQI